MTDIEERVQGSKGSRVQGKTKQSQAVQPSNPRTLKPSNPSSNRRHVIGVIGSGHNAPESDRVAEELGALIAKNGFYLVTGGRGGVMAAACKGAKREGGVTIGVLPGVDPSDANRHVDIPIPTGLGHARNVLVARTSDALIAVAGGYGTLSEIAIGLKIGKPVIGVDSWPDIRGLVKAVDAEDAIEKLKEYISFG